MLDFPCYVLLFRHQKIFKFQLFPYCIQFNYLPLVSSFTSIQSYSSSFFQTTKDLLVLIFQMAGEMRSIHNWCEVAPTLLISHSKSRRSSNSFKLEPIIEEEPQLSKSMLGKGIFSFPLLLSGLLYIFFYRELSVFGV